MRSSSDPWRRAAALLVLTVTVTAGCSSPPASSSTPATPAASSAPECQAPAEQAAAVAELRRAVESGPLYAAASTSGLASCVAATRDDAITIDYRFRDGASLHLTRSQTTEYTDQQIRLASPLTDDAVAVLTRAERAAFDAKGCGIDWAAMETSRPSDDPSATERIYRGDVCNCQARARSDANGRVIGLELRSAC